MGGGKREETVGATDEDHDFLSPSSNPAGWGVRAGVYALDVWAWEEGATSTVVAHPSVFLEKSYSSLEQLPRVSSPLYCSISLNRLES